MNEKTYLKWYNKLGYSVGDFAACCVSAIVANMILVYMTDYVGLNAGIIGTLILIAKSLDGVTDVIFGGIINRTKTKMGKARPWQLFAYIGCAVCLVALFSVPQGLGEGGKYVYFFIVYLMINSIFYTASYIAYCTLTSLITKNANERVQVNSMRSIMGNISTLIFNSVTLGLVTYFGGDLAAWRTAALIYAAIGLVLNAIAVFSVKELPESELCDLEQKEDGPQEENKLSFWSSLKLLITDKYFLGSMGLLLLVYIICTMHITGGVYYSLYIIGDYGFYTTINLCNSMPTIIGLCIAPMLVGKLGMYKFNIAGFLVGIVGRIIISIGSASVNLSLLTVGMVVSSLGICTVTATIVPMIATAAEITYLKRGVRLDGLYYSGSSIGVKVGSGLGSALCGMLLNVGGYVANAPEQTAGPISMMKVLFAHGPLVIAIAMFLILLMMNVEKIYAQEREKQGLKA